MFCLGLNPKCFVQGWTTKIIKKCSHVTIYGFITLTMLVCVYLAYLEILKLLLQHKFENWWLASTCIDTDRKPLSVSWEALLWKMLSLSTFLAMKTSPTTEWKIDKLELSWAVPSSVQLKLQGVPRELSKSVCLGESHKIQNISWNWCFHFAEIGRF